MHTLTFTACVQTSSVSVSEVGICVVPHKGEQGRVVEETDALHLMGRNEQVNTQLGNVANGYTGLISTRKRDSKRDSESVMSHK